MSLISVQHVSKAFQKRKAHTLLRDRLHDLISGPRLADSFYALDDVSFEIGEREGVAVIGANGAGKSTLLSMVCGLARPDRGVIEIRGSIAPMLELGSGFHPDLTGKENLYLNAALLGLRANEIKERYQAIVDFSGLGSFIDQTVRTYSSGMVLRLGFSVAVHCDPAIVVIDEVLGVGDLEFQHKCRDRIVAMRREGRTLLFVSHNPESTSEFCERAIWLHHGRVVLDGPVKEVAAAYSDFMNDPQHRLPAAIASQP